MAIIAPQTAQNYATGNYHRILKAELLCAPDEPTPKWHIMVGFYASEYARQMNPKEPLYTHHIYKSIETMLMEGLPDPRDQLYVFAMQDTQYINTNATADI